MKIDNYAFPKSTFLSVEKDYEIIVSRMLQNERLKKLLFYDVPECQEMPNLTQDQTMSLINNNIRLVPKVKVDPMILNQVLINFNDFATNATNPEYRDNIISFDVICPFDQWNLGDFKLRPYKIAGEIDAMFNNVHLTGIGKIEFLGAAQATLTEEFGGLVLLYQAVHFTEDKVK